MHPLGIDPNDYDDTRAFSARALEPRRTLIEKLFTIHHLATLFEAGDVREEERFGRHYYDIYKLLDHQPTLKKLRNDRDSFTRLIAEVERISRLRFGAATPRPADGFAASPAFTPDRNANLRKWLEKKFEDSLQLLPQRAAGPSFGQVVQRVHDNGGLL